MFRHIFLGAIALFSSGILTTQGLAASGAKFEDITPYIPKMDVNAGSAIAQLKCAECHSFEKGVSDKKGPSLWGVYNRNIGSLPNYKYSDALKNMNRKIWSYQELNRYLFNVGAYAPGTKMAFVSLSDTQERTNVIGWLSTLYDLPTQPQPAPAPAAPSYIDPSTPPMKKSATPTGVAPAPSGLPNNGGSVPH